MTSVGFFSFVPLLLGLFGAQPGVIAQSVTSLTIQDEVIMRIPVQPHRLMPQFEWVEKKGPKCIPVASIQGALLSGTEGVDFMMNNRSRVRAEFDEDCPALDFYRGFYLQVQGGKLCAGHDAIFSRMGGSCTIRRFKQLVPRLPR